MKRYEKFVLEAEKGVTFEVSEGTSGELIIRALNVTTPKVDSKTNVNAHITTTKVKSTNYMNPPIPEGYRHVCGEWNNGFVIERTSDGSQFVWIPVGSLDPNGTLDGKNFSEKFGRRDYIEPRSLMWRFKEDSQIELHEQIESVKKYGGFYFSAHNISKSSEGKPQSVRGVMPWTGINYEDAKKIASTIECTASVRSHLIFGPEYDSVLEWFIKNDVRTLFEITEDSTFWGNYSNTENSPMKMMKTGSREEWCTNHIYDLAGNVTEWTQELAFYIDKYHNVCRGGFFGYDGKGHYHTVACRQNFGPPRFGGGGANHWFSCGSLY